MANPSKSKSSSSSGSGSSSSSSSGEEQTHSSSSSSVANKTPTPPPPPPSPVKPAKSRKREAPETAFEAAETSTKIKKINPTLFKRLWTEADEVHLLKSLITNFEQKGVFPSKTDIDDFHNIVKDSLSIEFNDKQILGKIKKLKEKFRENVTLFQKNEQEHVKNMLVSFEKTVFDLSDTLWGAEVKAKMKRASKGKGKKSKLRGEGYVAADVSKVGKKLVAFSRGITDEEVTRMGLEVLSGDKKAEMEGKWRDLKIQELEVFLNKVDFLKERAQDVLKRIK